MIENEHICKNLVHTCDLVPFLLILAVFLTMSFCFYYWFWTGKYRFGRLSKMESLCHFILILLVLTFRPLVFRVSFFSIFQFIGDATHFRVTILKQTNKREKQFSRWQRVWSEAKFLMVNKNERSKIRFYWYFGLFPETIFKV